jgi:hypothetical protein
MPVQNYGAIMQGAADLTAMPANAFAQGQSRRQAQDYRNSLLGMDQQRLAMDQQQYGDKMAAQAAEDEEQDQAADLLRAEKYNEAMLIDPELTQQVMQARGLDPQTVLSRDKLAQDKSQFDARMGIDQQQFNARMALERAQEARLARGGGDDEFARYQAMNPEQRDLYDRMKGRKAGGGGVTVGPDGQLMVTPDPSKATEGERVSANYLGRMEAAEQKLGDYTPGLKDFVAARTVLNGNAVTSSVANKALSKEGQGYYQAAADWVRAKLRKESGAVITPQEMEQEIKTYFPIPGDAPATVEQKRVARQQAMEGMRGMGGRAVTQKQQAAPKQGNRRVKFEDL